jgi:hypothetical protein
MCFGMWFGELLKSCDFELAIQQNELLTCNYTKQPYDYLATQSFSTSHAYFHKEN